MSLAYRISAYNRRRKWRLFQAAFPPRPDFSILDVGFSEKEYAPTDNFLEKNYPYPDKITALGVDKPRDFGHRYPRVRAVQYDGEKFPFADKSFDLAWSNAVLEHVGSREAQRRFLSEINRVSKRAFLTTPNRLFPIEVHTRTILLHLLPRPFFHRYLKLIGKSWAAGDYMHLLSLGEIKRLLSEAGIKEYRIIKNRLGGFILDFIIIWGEDKKK